MCEKERKIVIVFCNCHRFIYMFFSVLTRSLRKYQARNNKDLSDGMVIVCRCKNGCSVKLARSGMDNLGKAASGRLACCYEGRNGRYLSGSCRSFSAVTACCPSLQRF